MRKLLLAVTLGLASLSISQIASAQQAPDEFVREAAELLDEAVSERKQELASDRQALYELINEILLPRFDRRYAAQLVLGRHWRTASEEQREQFIEAFYQSLMRQYADGLLEFDLSQLEILPYRGDPTEPRTVVRTVVKLDDGTEAPVDYGLVNKDSGWQVFDVTIEGISYVRNFRAEFNSEIQATDLDAVIQRLQREAAQGPSEEAAGPEEATATE
ncbi:MAG TPA: ABC transporter substrate-binding protein [Woeseiaceae bacterium]|nr:ABC transporter substrate-binding protein [Woeseiaceae bacterium]